MQECVWPGQVHDLYLRHCHTNWVCTCVSAKCLVRTGTRCSAYCCCSSGVLVTCSAILGQMMLSTLSGMQLDQ
jgi:hypothetical protein